MVRDKVNPLPSLVCFNYRAFEVVAALVADDRCERQVAFVYLLQHLAEELVAASHETLLTLKAYLHLQIERVRLFLARSYREVQYFDFTVHDCFYLDVVSLKGTFDFLA